MARISQGNRSTDKAILTAAAAAAAVKDRLAGTCNAACIAKALSFGRFGKRCSFDLLG